MQPVRREGEERRRYPRAPLSVSVSLSSAKERLAGCTIDVGAGGACVDLPDASGLRRGQDVEVRLGPPLQGRGKCEFAGRIVRIAGRRCAVQADSAPVDFLLVPELLGRHPIMVDLKDKILRTAATDLNVLLTGETGVGKSAVAALIHLNSRRADGPLVRVSCPSSPTPLLERQLFGLVAEDREVPVNGHGAFRDASGGTLVLDEIAAVERTLQKKLLQAIEEKRFIPVGGSRFVEADVRIVATTNTNLHARVATDHFRGDLLYRLCQLTLEVPPLRKRAGDIPLLVDGFHRRFTREYGKRYRAIPRSAMDRLLSHPWPGNVRELENEVRRAVLLEEFDLPPTDGRETGESGSDIRSLTRAAQQAAVRRALEQAGGNKTRAAAILGISYRTLLRRLKAFGPD